ncbi:hypothetical protein DSECCO2_379500 [anaerobic digester metagenome]
MKSFTKKSLAALMIIATLSCVLCVGASARSSDYLSAYSAGLTPKSGGRIVVSVDVAGVGYMTQIGASNVTIYRSSDQTNWDSVASYSSANYPSMLTSGYSCNMDVITYYGTPGYYYFAVVNCYAGNASGHDSRLYTTSNVKAIS